MADPQLDANVLIRLLRKEAPFVSYANFHQPFGLSYNGATAREFLAKATLPDLDVLEKSYGILCISDISLAEIDAVSKLLTRAFSGDPWGRILHEGDAKVAATAFLKKETLATADLHFYKRIRDLGLNADFIGAPIARAKAKSYVPRLVTVPSS